ncbi:MAG: hypothetical protein JWP69_688 [Flaviaesturariibacter sp.]|nr:hypothetical protein [Flaviaesturariibacter sp.]
MRNRLFCLVVASLVLFTGCSQKESNSYLLLFYDDPKEQYGYKDTTGKIIIPPGKYDYCYTDTFRTYAIVVSQDTGLIAIDRQEKRLYEVYSFDNGPDEVSEGFFRIVENEKIGFADAATGKIIISPQFHCAFPFENGHAKVSTDCRVKSAGEHKEWVSSKWFYIDKTGKRISDTN